MIPGYLAGAFRDRPQIGDYAYRARKFPLAQQAIARAMAEHGTEAIPTCLCGGPVAYGRSESYGQCEQCRESPASSLDHVDFRHAAPGGPRSGGDR